MRSAILGFAAGIALLQMQAELLPFEWHMALLAAAAVLLLMAWRLGRTGIGAVLRIAVFNIAGICVGFAWGGLYAQYHLDQELPVAWEGQEVTVVGTVDSLPYRFERGVRFNFLVETIAPQVNGTPPIPSRLSLAWYSAGPFENTEAISPAVPQVQPGERWQLTLRLKRPHGTANPNGFDYEVWLLEQGVRATGTVRSDAQLAYKNQRLQAFVQTPANIVQYCRGWLRDRILAALPNQKYANVIVALVIGDQRAIEQSEWEIFNRTGVGHLVAISGLHITMIAGLFAAFVGFLWRRSFFTRAQLPLILPAPKVAVLAGLAAALIYVLLAGFGVPAQRTLYMLAVVGMAFWMGRLTHVSYVLCLALGVVLLADPWALLWPGFWLSFGAVAIILFASSGRIGSDAIAEPVVMTAIERHRKPPRAVMLWRAIRAGAYTQYIVTLGLLPLTLLLFGQYSLVSPLANAIAIPLITLLVAPLSLLGSILPPPLSTWILRSAHAMVEWLVGVLSWMSSQPFAVWQTPLPAMWMFLLALAGTLLLLAPRGWPARWLGLFGWLPLLLNAPTWPEEGKMQVTAFDVGQGMALLVETAEHRLLYDTGPAYSRESDGGNRVIVPYLKSRGINHLDVVVVSHSDNDHSGGALSVLKDISVDRVYSSLSPASPIVQAAPDHRRCLAGQHWRWDGAEFSMLYPVQSIYDSDKWKPNARSCVLKVSLGKNSILLPGDIEAIQEDELVNSPAAASLRATVLLAPHHGSGTSSTEAFLRAVNPEVALFQVGYRNRFNHPKPAVFERYAQMGIRRMRNDEAGAITVHFDKGVTVQEYRREHARYWYGR
ncbi:DNA internalization-related competence protein ComEC/Rec2 [Herbaspirillum sp. meg3]|uniref:DNA internalization-related competence protein ComEC/Rec2 n=1 Tax=Herbaspirillum sp. meg3 TaxID=2025949 RepID=UPI000B998EFC|nr:DNA internalization-related competence protein ComEC/Rec2 [Herbaspirillum sp. meg3]ASU38467.1 DNA internalization-related competence protein ComEC/Rec2 [Herbaspirillum sp. meg3]